MIRMIALDLDGTLAIENHQVLPATRTALDDLHHGGVEVVIATGRRYRTTRFVIDNLGFEVYAVCNGGALVKTPEQNTLHKDTFDVAPIARIAREIGLTVFAQRDAHSDGGSDFMIDETDNWNPQIQKYFDDNQEFSSTGNLIDSEPEFLVSGMFGPEADLRKFSDTT